MIDTSSMSPVLALSLINRERDKFEASVQADPLSKREIETFREKIGQIKTVEDLTGDYQVFSFVMKAFGFEDQIYAKALVERVLTSDLENSGSLANTLNMGQYKGMATELGFGTDGAAPAQFQDPDWVNALVERYVDQRVVDEQREISNTVGSALYFQEHASKIKNWYDVLADATLASVMRTTFGISSEAAAGDLESQVRLFASKMDIADFQDPDLVKNMAVKYAAIKDALEPEERGNSLITQLFASSTGNGSWNYVTLDMELVSAFNPGATR